MADDQISDFPGNDIEVHFDQSLCIGIGECGRATGDLFQQGRTPWCMPDASTPAEVREIVERCPSGALSYSDKTGGPETPPSENRITVISDGPLYATGDLHIEGAPAEKPGLKTRAALCRCGKSQNKPFCDNSHRAAKFCDYGAVGDSGPGLETEGGPLELKAIDHGPLLVKGNFKIRAASGRIAWAGEKVALCRCGASENKPFCDAKHREIDW
ncbi:CDGSH iron-sulfur domain-containing protein [Thiorhodovibrio frisius]|uniref:Iron-binding zinc finger CDGSH type domain-containing protein n=1 Tax=Thiorhodovibrio frisius TaxID=631362 RepID=H8Z0L2_9GAMM|nr:CDGSH iron-sulfur domain-containing protein [Thiorhodovibrio frisius]EIC22353.1 hypothetical protein Thi970DRAFT_02609 [Thiorhodovibrio frisius]WPL24652.1 hypothetical protein Thiofri_04872 [Thiorhodovibrio frisius]